MQDSASIFRVSRTYVQLRTDVLCCWFAYIFSYTLAVLLYCLPAGLHSCLLAHTWLQLALLPLHPYWLAILLACLLADLYLHFFVYLRTSPTIHYLPAYLTNPVAYLRTDVQHICMRAQMNNHNQCMRILYKYVHTAINIEYKLI